MLRALRGCFAPLLLVAGLLAPFAGRAHALDPVLCHLQESNCAAGVNLGSQLIRNIGDFESYDPAPHEIRLEDLQPDNTWPCQFIRNDCVCHDEPGDQVAAPLLPYTVGPFYLSSMVTPTIRVTWHTRFIWLQCWRYKAVYDGIPEESTCWQKDESSPLQGWLQFSHVDD